MEPDHDPRADRNRDLAAAWRRVAHDARQLAALYQRARVSTQPALVDHTSRRRDQTWVPVWILGEYQPQRRVYAETADGRVMGSMMEPELPGVALLADGSLYTYRLVRGKLMLALPLQQAAPLQPPAHDGFAALTQKILGSR